MKTQHLMELAIAEINNGKQLNVTLANKIKRFYDELTREERKFDDRQIEDAPFEDNKEQEDETQEESKPEPEQTYIVIEPHLKGNIKDLPLEIVQQMVNEQVKQGNKADVTIFQKNISANSEQGGFDWIDAKDGGDFWCEVMYGKNFDLFFEKYPKN